MCCSRDLRGDMKPTFFPLTRMGAPEVRRDSGSKYTRPYLRGTGMGSKEGVHSPCSTKELQCARWRGLQSNVVIATRAWKLSYNRWNELFHIVFTWFCSPSHASLSMSFSLTLVTFFSWQDDDVLSRFTRAIRACIVKNIS